MTTRTNAPVAFPFEDDPRDLAEALTDPGCFLDRALYAARLAVCATVGAVVTLLALRRWEHRS